MTGKWIAVCMLSAFSVYADDVLLEEKLTVDNTHLIVPVANSESRCIWASTMAIH